MMDDYGSWSAASQLLSYCVLPARLLLRPIVHSCSQTIVLPGPASVRETLGGPVTTLLSWPVCAVLACRFAESSHAPTMQAHGARPSSSSTCASRTLSPLSLEPARARLASTVRRTPTTCSGKIACGPHEQHPVSCSALLLHPSSRRHPGLITVLLTRAGRLFQATAPQPVYYCIGSASRTCSHLVPRRHDLVARSLSSLQKRAQAASSDRRCRYCYGNMRIR
jgi:hypothetical protein